MESGVLGVVRSNSFAAALYHSERKEEDRIWEYYALQGKMEGTMEFVSAEKRWERRFLAIISHICFLHRSSLHS